MLWPIGACYTYRMTNKTQEVVAALKAHGSVQVRGLTGEHRKPVKDDKGQPVLDKQGNAVTYVVKRTRDRAVLRLVLERETQRSVSLLALGETAIYSFN